jgi:hypothetical protein
MKSAIGLRNTTLKILLLAASMLLASPLFEAQAVQGEGGQSQNPQVARSATVPTSFQDYHKTCRQRATAEGLPPDVAQDLCNCTIKKFQSQYTLNQFQALVKKATNDKNSQRTLTQVGEACFEEVLYE